MDTLPTLRSGQARTAFGTVRLPDDIEIPFGIVEGPEPGPCLLVTAGVHGSEFCSIEAAVRLMQTNPESINGTLLILPILNMQGFYKRSIYVMPQDGKNLNRVFPGNPDGSTSERLADWLVTQVYPHVDAYVDLHGGDLDEALAPFTIYPGSCEKSKALARAFGIPTAVAAGVGGNTINAANRLGVPSILPEVSGNGLWDETNVAQVMSGVHRVMHHIGMVTRSVAPVRQEELNSLTMWVPTASHTGLWYPAKALSESVAEGDLLGEIRNVFGEVLARVLSEKGGMILYRLTSLSVNKGEALLGVGTPIPG